MIKTYDPNIRWGKHTWEFTFQIWDYTITLTQELGGNCRGASTLEYALGNLAVRLYDEQGEYPELQMKRVNPDTLEEEILFNTLEDGCIEEELNSMLVKAELVSHIEDKK